MNALLGQGGVRPSPAITFRPSFVPAILYPVTPSHLASRSVCLFPFRFSRWLRVLPEFIFRAALADGRLERLLPDWPLPAGAVHWVTPSGRLRPRRVDLLGSFFAQRLSRQGTVSKTAAARTKVPKANQARRRV
jgi:DNA-binding transcriptional LysR family regulator